MIPEAPRRHDAPAGRPRGPGAPRARAFARGAHRSRGDFNPNPGFRPFQRANRAEYARAVRDLLDVEVDVNTFLPPDTISDGFDNVADAQTLSPTLMEGYLRAASQISRLAVGDRNATATSVTYKIPRARSQMAHVEGAPIGTRGGVSEIHVFPADGDHLQGRLALRTPRGLTGRATMSAFGLSELIDVSIDGERGGTLELNSRMSESDPKNNLEPQTPPIHVKAGRHRVSAAFVQTFEAIPDDLVVPLENTLADVSIGRASRCCRTCASSASSASRVTGVSDTPSRRRIFTCRPTSSDEERAALGTSSGLATYAFRGPVSATISRPPKRSIARDAQSDFEWHSARVAGDSRQPAFCVSLRRGAADRSTRSELSHQRRRSGVTSVVLPVGDRARCRTAEDRGEPHVTRPRRSRQAGQADARRSPRRGIVDAVRGAVAPAAGPGQGQPCLLQVPAIRRSTRLEHATRDGAVLRQSRARGPQPAGLGDRRLLVRGRTLALHYGIPNVTGPEFRRVTLPENRRGILGHGSILVLTSNSDRTSPVYRGKWVMEVLLGSPPPPPPPNVPELDEVKSTAAGRTLSVRERMEEHRKNPTCNSCHRVIDPLGLALENYDPGGLAHQGQRGRRRSSGSAL